MAKILEVLSSDYSEILATSAADLTDSPLVTEGSLNGFPLIDVDVSENANYAFIWKASRVRVAKAVGALAEGVAVYYVTANDNVATSGDVLIGFVAKAALSADTHVEITFDGSLAFAKV